QPECNLSDSAEVMVSFIENPNVSGLEINILNLCSGQDLDISLSNMILLLDDNYSISYTITGPDSFSGMINLIVTNGNANFTISNNSLENPGIYEFNITAFLNANSNCTADLSTILPSSFEVFETITPEILVDGNFFCPSDNATIQDLSNNITSSGTIEWYSAPIGGTLLNVDDILIDGESYFASIITDNGCVSIERLEVIANIGPCEEDLIIPDGFSPNGDTINDTFLIRNLEELYPNFKLTIYNRNGNKLYEGDINSPLWNGTTTTSRIGSGIVPVGVYFYILEFNDGIKEAVQGRVYLSR
ncbi:gliding motility-associated C-terminal domain-containing protein, partial [Ichthyenterobacterium sp. W332]